MYIHYGDIHATYKTELIDFKTETRIPYLKDEYINVNLNYLQEGDLVLADASEDLVGIGNCFFRNLAKAITKEDELFAHSKQVDLVINDYGKVPTTEEINKWALDIRNQTLTAIKEKTNANNPNAVS